uniref:Uncharacterized protein n=1 Tax=Trichuris muris TaxID=70415 RepID=A0A5S6QN46_TRIMR
MEGLPVYNGKVPPNGIEIHSPTSRFTPGKEFLRFMRTTIRHWDLWPMVGVMCGFVAGTVFICAYNLTKYDVWLDRTKAVPPWDWSRFRDKYRTQTTRLMGREALYKCYEESSGPIEQLEDELLELRKKYLSEHKA